MLNGLDLFTGIGGISLALKPWVRTVCYVEIDRYCQGVIRSRIEDGNLEDAPIWDDVTTFDPEPWIGSVDIIFGGFPCQDISLAGNGAGLDGERSGLFWEIIRLAGEIRPRFIYLENVPAITGRGGREVVGALASLGYDCRWGVLSAFDVGAPHQRERWWCLAHAAGQRRGEGFSESVNEGQAITGGDCGGESDVADADHTGLEIGQGQPGDDGEEQQAPFRTDWWLSEPDVGRVVDGISAHMDCLGGVSISSAPRPEKGKTSAGRTHRLKGIGNSVVPACAQEAFSRLMFG